MFKCRNSSLRLMRPTLAGLLLAALALGATDTVVAFDAPDPSAEENTAIRSQLGGEAFQTSLFSGSVSTGLGIAVPPGTNGMQPKLTIAYDNSLRNEDDSLIGAGWNLTGLGYIERSSKFGVPRYDSTDTYVLNFGAGKYDLVYVTPSATQPVLTGYYHTREETFLRATYDATADSWLVTDKSGTQYSFGASVDSKTLPIGRTGTRRWSLNLVTDMHGNRMRIAYLNNPKDLATGVLDTGAVYPSLISYTEGNGLTTFRTVEFAYEARPDVVTLYRSSSPVMIDRRLVAVDVKMNSAIVRRYELTYQAATDSSESLLKQVQEFGVNADPAVRGIGTSLPAVSFGYSAGDGRFDTTPTEPWATQLADAFTDTDGEHIPAFLTDLTGDGRADFLTCQADSWYVATSTGTGFTASTTPWLTGVACSNRIISLGDFNGDGKGDLGMITAPDRITVYLSTPSSTLVSGWQWVCPLSGGLCGVLAGRFGDFDGDGKTDIAFSVVNAASSCGTYGLPNTEDCILWQVQLSTGASFATPQQWFWYASSAGALWTRVGDFDGNGMSDLIVDFGGVGRNKIWVALSTGSGFWGTNSGYWLNPHPTDASGAPVPRGRWKLDDFNGDGLTDAVVFDENLTTASVILSKGNAFQPPNAWLGPVASWCTPTASCSPFLNTGDANGDGKADLLVLNNQTTGNWFWQVALSSGKKFDAPGSGSWRSMTDLTCMAELFEDFDGDGKLDLGRYAARTSGCSTNSGAFQVFLSAGPPIDLVTTINNGLGGTTTLDYRSTGATNGCASGVTGLVVKLYTLCTSTQNDGMGWLSTTQYGYQGEQYNPTSREFWGFSTATVTDPTGAYTRTTFLQTNQLRGKPSVAKTSSADGTMSNTTTNAWSSSNPITGAPSIVLPVLNSVTTSVTDDGGATTKQTSTTYGYDAYGNVTSVGSLGDTAVTGDERYDYTEYAYNTTAWILNRPTHVYTRKSDNTIVAQSWNFYDNGTTVIPPGSITTAITKGDLTKVCRWLSTAPNPGPTPCTAETTFGYDPTYGNRTSVMDANGHASSTAYDTTYQTFPITETNALSQSVIRTYWGVNTSLSASIVGGAYTVPGLPATVSDLNGVQNASYWDELGRSKATVVPPDTAGAPTTITTYHLNGGAAPEDTVVQRREKAGAGGTLDSTAFVDGLGRTIQTRTEAPDGTNQVVVDTTYNSRGLVDTVSIPYSASTSATYTGPSTTAKKTTTVYDSLRRVTQVTNTDGTYSSRSYDKWTTTLIDPDGRKKVETRDAFGRLITVQEYTGSDGRAAAMGVPSAGYSPYTTTPTQYAYDTLGNLVQTTDTLGNVATMSYDTLGRKVAMHDPDMGDWSYQYDPVGNLLQQIDGKGQTIAFTYDALNRIKRKTTTSAPTPPADLSGVIAVTAGLVHTCALLGDGTVWCWGDNSPTPVAVGGLSGVAAVTAGDYHTCALLGDGTVWCWGSNINGQLGNGAPLSAGSDSPTPVPVSGTFGVGVLSGVTAVAAGGQHTCARLGDRTVRCWGNNDYGQLGNNTTTTSSTPVPVSGLTTATAIAAGSNHTCAVLGNGTAQCWGDNHRGQGGHWLAVYTRVPVTVNGPSGVGVLSGVTAVTAGGVHTCALLGGGTLQCWGGNDYGQLGNGDSGFGVYSPFPVPVSGPSGVGVLSGVTAVTAGGVHTCALLGGGTLQCWGGNDSGQLGNGVTSYTQPTPVAVGGLPGVTVTVVEGGYNYTCAVLGDGTVRCWGNNASGQLGNGTTANWTLPIGVVLSVPPTALSVMDSPGDTGGALRLAWTPSTWAGATQQRVYRGTASGGPYTLVTTIPNNTTATYTDTGLVNGTTYYYVTRAFDGTRESANSNQASAVPMSNVDTTPPTGTVSINSGAAATNTTAVTLTLTCADMGLGCTWMQVAVDGTADTEVFVAYATSVSATLQGGDGTKTVAVKLRDGAGNVSGQVTDTILLDTTTPTISAVAAGYLTSAGTTITWTTNEAADSQVEYGPTTAYGSSTTVDSTLVSSHSVLLPGLNPSTSYHYRVKSRDAAGNLATGADAPFTTMAAGMGPVAWYRFEETGTITTVADASGNSNTGTNHGATSFTPGKVGNAFSFSGANAYVDIPNGFTNTIKGSDTHTIMMWVYPQSVANAPVLLDAPGLGSAGAFVEIGNAAGSTYYWGYGGSYRTYSGTMLSASTWHHLAFVKTGATTGNLYVDGVEQTSYTGGFLQTPNVASNLFLGAYQGPSAPLNGNLDEVKIYNRALLQSEVQAEMAAGPPLAPPTNLVASATSTTQVSLTWTASASAGVASYNVERSANNGAFTLVASPTTTSFIDTVPAAGTTYLYKVRAVSTGGGNPSAYSNMDYATTQTFIDEPTIRAVHFVELANAVSAVRRSAGLSAFAWTATDGTGNPIPPPAVGNVVMTQHMLDLRSQLNQALTALGVPPRSDEAITPQSTPVKKQHLIDIRQGTKGVP